MADAFCANGSAVSQKRLRNRVSQQAFRKRQSDYIKDLERRLEIKGNGDNEQIVRLVEDNRALREQLTTACRKLERIQITLRSLSESMLSHVSHGSASDLTSPEQTLSPSHKGSEGVTTGNSRMMTTRPQPTAPSGTASSDADQHDDEVSRLRSNVDGDQLLPSTLLDALLTDENHGVEQTSFSLDSSVQGRQTPVDLDMLGSLGNFSEIRSLPGIWTHEYQMGPASFHTQSPSTDKITQGLANTNSSFSDHMQMIRGCLKMQWRKASRIWTEVDTSQVILRLPSRCHALICRRDGLYLSATILLSHFHSLTRPAALAWYTATRFQENITNLLLWQIDRSRLIYSRMHANYRPSALQLLEDYPSVIDWCPFPTIRDKLILLHSANPYLDQIICDIATAYVVEIDADKLILGQTGRAYIRVWDLVCAFEAEDIEDPVAQDVGRGPGQLLASDTDGHLPSSFPAPNADCLFQPPYARRVFKMLGLDDGVPRFKVDPSFFIQYSELYDPGADILATGIALKPSVQTKLPCPTWPRHETMNIYRNVADWCINAICKASLGEKA